MPTYEYECTSCGAVVDIFQSMIEPTRKKLRKNDPKPCDCGAAVQRRIGTGAGVIFKGSGFYQTDYRSDSYKKGAKAESERTDKKAEKTDAKSKDSTPTTKSTPKGDSKPEKKS